MALCVLRALTLAPWRMSSETRGAWPWRAATCSGVNPSAELLFTPSPPVCRLPSFCTANTNSVILIHSKHKLS